MTRDGRTAGYARLALRPAEGRAWWWTAVVGADLGLGRWSDSRSALGAEAGDLLQPATLHVEHGARRAVTRPTEGFPTSALVVVRDHEVDLPRGRSLEIRGPGLWAEATCEEPFDHWSVGLEAFAVALEDPTDAYGDERGDPVALGLDLGWEAEAEPRRLAGRTGYQQPCAVHGEVLVGARRLPVTGRGTRAHSWGDLDWWGSTSVWAAGHTVDGAPLEGDAPAVEVDGRGLVAAARLGAHRLAPVIHAPVQVPPPAGRGGGPSRLARALCRAEPVDGATGPGWAWSERLLPPGR